MTTKKRSAKRDWVANWVRQKLEQKTLRAKCFNLQEMHAPLITTFYHNIMVITFLLSHEAYYIQTKASESLQGHNNFILQLDSTNKSTIIKKGNGLWRGIESAKATCKRSLD